MASSWYDTGFDEFDNRKEEQEQSRTYQPSRLWMRPDEEREVVFIDDDGFGFWEHQLKIGDSWTNWFSCIKKLCPDGCPICNSGKNNYYVMMFTVLDCTPWTDSNGNEHQFFRKVLAAKTDVAKGIRRTKQRRGSLVGCKYAFYRAGDRSPSCGDMKEFVEEVDLDDSMYEYRNREGQIIKPTKFEYEKVFAPLSHPDLVRVVRSATGGGNVGGGQSGGNSKANSRKRSSGRTEKRDDYEDDIPF